MFVAIGHNRFDHLADLSPQAHGSVHALVQSSGLVRFEQSKDTEASPPAFLKTQQCQSRNSCAKQIECRVRMFGKGYAKVESNTADARHAQPRSRAR
jgi:hypothetical protein